jgi:type I restriction enzyme S subunit
MSYKEEKLGNYIDILSGFAFKTKDFTETGIPIIKIKNIKPPEVILEDLTYVSYDVAKKQSKFMLSYDDVLIAMTGSHINQWASVVGRVAKVKYYVPTLLNQRVGKVIVKDSSKVDKDYVYYYLAQDSVKIKLAAKAGGAANQANISSSDIQNLVFPCPNVEIQREIGKILRSYDDLIETNQKQIKLLEEAAQRLYKEWFVDLRFPGHENVAIVDGVPEGWKKGNISDICETVGGGTPSTTHDEYYKEGTIKWVTPTDLTKSKGLILLDTEKKITQLGLNNSSAKLLPPNTILMTSRASIGYFSLCETEVCTNQGFISCIPYNEKNRYYLLFNLINRVPEIKEKATGSTFLEIAKRTFREMDIVIPDEGIAMHFYEMTDPIFERMRVLQKEINGLSEARDRLLPKLMSGEIKL